MATTAENLQELLPAAEPEKPPNLLPELPAPPGVKTQSAGTELMSATATPPGAQTLGAPRTAATSEVQGKETTQGQLTELLGANSPYVRQAEGAATRYAASRGLQNSSIAAQAGRKAAIDAALPIANADAGVFERRELARLGTENQLLTQREAGDIASRLQGEGAVQELARLAAAGDQQARLQLEQHRQQLEQQAAAGDIEAKLQLERHNQTLAQIGAQGGVQLQLQERENANRQWLAQFDAQAQQALQAVDLATRERMQQAGFTQEQALQAAEQQQQQWLAQFDAATREKLQGLDADVRLVMQGLELDAQERIANLNVSAAQRSDAARMASTFELGYSSFLQTLMNNPDIPADARQTYMDHAAAMRDSNLALVEQFFDFDLEW
jgi:hypothetical protein